MSGVRAGLPELEVLADLVVAAVGGGKPQAAYRALLEPMEPGVTAVSATLTRSGPDGQRQQFQVTVTELTGESRREMNERTS